jgi:hypothetical protein
MTVSNIGKLLTAAFVSLDAAALIKIAPNEKAWVYPVLVSAVVLVATILYDVLYASPKAGRTSRQRTSRK